jgi:hypothetical protein
MLINRTGSGVRDSRFGIPVQRFLTTGVVELADASLGRSHSLVRTVSYAAMVRQLGLPIADAQTPPGSTFEFH